jgi:hypothetical protein
MRPENLNWRIIEDMTPIERAKAIYHEVNIEEMIKYLHLPPEQAISSLSNFGEIVEATGGKLNDDTGITRNNFFLGNEWVKIRNSFYQSKEWRAFRQTIIKERGNKCEKCKKQVTSFIIHHKRNIGMVVVEEGFLNELKHMDRFTVECRECHEDEHGSYIKAMNKPLKERMKVYRAENKIDSGKVMDILERIAHIQNGIVTHRERMSTVKERAEKIREQIRLKRRKKSI